MNPSRPTLLHTAAPCIALLLLAAPVAAEQDMSGWPDWLKTAMLAESPSDGSKTQTFAEGASVDLPGEPQETQATESGWYMPTQMGEGGLIECYLYTTGPDLAATAVGLGNANIELMSQVYGPVDNKSVYHLDAGAIDGVPYFALEWMYTVGEAPEAKAALTKVRAAVNGDVVQACSHNGLGYRETLGKAFRTFVTSLDYPSTTPEPYYREVAKMSLGEVPLGLVWFSYTLDADGDTEVRSVDAQIIPVDADTLQYRDTTSISYSRPTGELINQSSATAENGELTTHLELRRDDEENWAVSGTFKHKELDVTLDGTTVLLSTLGQQLRGREFVIDDLDRDTYDTWIPDADPTSFLTGVVERIDDDSPNNARLIMGPIRMDVEVDETGSAKRASMQAGPAVMYIERIYVDGKLR